MTALEVIIIVVAVSAAGIGLLRLLGVIGSPRDAHPGSTWMDHLDEIPVEQRASEDARDPAIPILSRPRVAAWEDEGGRVSGDEAA